MEHKQNKMKKPTTNKQELLFTAIENGSVSLIDFPYLSGFRTRISELRKDGIIFKTETITQLNRFGRKIRYHKHILTDKTFALSVYNKIAK